MTLTGGTADHIIAWADTPPGATGPAEEYTYASTGDGLRRTTTRHTAGADPVTDMFVWSQGLGGIAVLLTDGWYGFGYGSGMVFLAHIATVGTGGGTGRVAFRDVAAFGSVRATNTRGEERVWFGDDIHGYATHTAGDSNATRFGYADAYTDPTGLDWRDWAYDADSAWCREDLGYHAVGAVPFIRVAAARRKPATAALRRTPAAGRTTRSPGHTAAKAGPGAWGTAVESMSSRAAAYHARVTGGAAGSVYRVGGVNFDGFANGVLQEAKGPGYANFVRNGQFQPWFSGADGLASQAQRQLAVAGALRSPGQWPSRRPRPRSTTCS